MYGVFIRFTPEEMIAKEAYFFIDKNAKSKAINNLIDRKKGLSGLQEITFFSFASGIFSVPATGVYHFDTDVQGVTNIPTNGYEILELRVNNIPVRNVSAFFSANNTLPYLSISCDLSLVAGGIVKVYLLQNNTGNISTSVGGTEDRFNPHFNGHRIF